MGWWKRCLASTIARRRKLISGVQDAAKKKATSVAFTPIQVATLYGYPQATGQGQCVGIIELGGGFTPSDLQTYFAKLKVATPTVTAVPVDGGKNAPTKDANGPDGEVMLDIEVIGAIAPRHTSRSTSLPTPMRAFWMRSPPRSTTRKTSRR